MSVKMETLLRVLEVLAMADTSRTLNERSGGYLGELSAQAFLVGLQLRSELGISGAQVQVEKAA